MSIKLTARQKAQPIYTAAGVWNIIHPICMRENKMRRKNTYCQALGIAFSQNYIMNYGGLSITSYLFLPLKY